MSRSHILREQSGYRETTLVGLSTEDIIREVSFRLIEQSGGLREFCQWAWPILEPATPLAWEWCHDAMCDHLEAVSCGHIQKLLINIPPRHMKSTIVTIMWPCWDWGPAKRSDKRWIFSSYAQSLSLRDSLRRRLIFEDPWYKAGWGHQFKIGGQRFLVDAQVKYGNNHMGYHLSTSVTGSNTGEGGDVLVADDPHNMAEIHSDTLRQRVTTWWKEVMATRLNDQRTGAKVIIMQRGHEEDLSGRAIEEGYTHLNLQAEFRPDKRCRTFLDSQKRLNPETKVIEVPEGAEPFFADPRQEYGELLSPTRFPDYVIAQLKIDLGDAYDAQFQQDPTPEAGGVLKEAWWRFWAPAEHELVGTEIVKAFKNHKNETEVFRSRVEPLPNKFQELINSWDMAFGDDEEAANSFVVGQAWGRHKAMCFLLSQERQHHDFIESEKAVVRLYNNGHPRQKPNRTIIEAKANGVGIIRTLKDSIPGLIGKDVSDSKIARAHGASPRVKAGNYYLPHPELEEAWCVQDGKRINWVKAFLHETKMFPNSTYNDQVDAFTQADWELFGQYVVDESRFVNSID